MARQLCLQSLEEALHAVDPYRCVLSFVKVKDGQLRTKDFTISLSRFSSILVLAVGKASAPMMKAAFEILGNHETRGVIVAPHDERIPIRDRRIQVLRRPSNTGY